MNLASIINHNINNYRPHSYARQNKHYKEWEIDFIKNNYKTMTDTEIGKQLKRTAVSIRQKRFELNLMKEQHRQLTLKEINHIKTNYANSTLIKLASELKVNRKTVQSHVIKLGIRKTVEVV